MYPLINNYFEPIRDASRFEPGQLWWVCFPNPWNRPEICRVWRSNGSKLINVRDFDPHKEQADSVTGTAPNEFMGLTKFKQRPIVVLSVSAKPFAAGSWKGGARLLVAPIFTLKEEITGEYKVSPRFVWDFMTYQCDSVFYLPPNPTFDILEAVIRLDYMATIHESWLASPRKAQLTKDAMNCLNEWFRHYIWGCVQGSFQRDLLTYRELVGSDPEIRVGIFGPNTV